MYLEEENVRVLRGQLFVHRGHHLAGAAPRRRKIYLHCENRGQAVRDGLEMGECTIPCEAQGRRAQGGRGGEWRAGDGSSGGDSKGSHVVRITLVPPTSGDKRCNFEPYGWNGLRTNKEKRKSVFTRGCVASPGSFTPADDASESPQYRV